MISNPTLIDHIKFTSELKNLVLVESLINKVLQGKNISEDIYGNILIGVTEAVNNAIIHGNLRKKELNVEVLVNQSPNSLLFTVIDQGKGFNFHDLPDPTSPENIEKENGRGIFLIKNLADKMIIDEPGNVIHIFFNYD